MRSPFSVKLIKALRSTPWVRNALLVVAWLGVWEIGRLVEYIEHASVWFPAAGLTYAALLIVGIRAIPAITVSGAIITLWAGYYYNLGLNSQQLLLAGCVFSLAHITPYLISAKILTWLSKSAYNSVPQLIIAFLVSSAVFSLVATLSVISGLIVTNMMPATSFSEALLPFWIGDFAGLVVIGPLFAILLSFIYPESAFNLKELVDVRIRKPSVEYKFKIAINLLLLAGSMMLAKYAPVPEAAYAIFFLAITHMWIACTENPFFNVLSLVISSFLIAFGVNVFGLMDNAILYQFAIVVVATNALFGIAVPALTADNNKLREMVFTDSLTQVASRDHLQQRAELEILRSQKDGVPLCLMVFDVDNFKLINDQYGHTIGDNVLKQMTAAARESLRPSDILGRYGGDEFVAILPGSNLADAISVSERVLDSFVDVAIGNKPVTASFGVTEARPEDCFISMFERADIALYEAKKAGRNRVHVGEVCRSNSEQAS